MEVEEEEVMEGEDQFGLTSINIDIFFSFSFQWLETLF